MKNIGAEGHLFVSAENAALDGHALIGGHVLRATTDGLAFECIGGARTINV